MARIQRMNRLGPKGILGPEGRHYVPYDVWDERDWKEEHKLRAELNAKLEPRQPVAPADVLLPTGFRVAEGASERRTRLVDEALRKHGLR